MVQRRTDRYYSALDTARAFAICQMPFNKITGRSFAHYQAITVGSRPIDEVFHGSTVSPDN